MPSDVLENDENLDRFGGGNWHLNGHLLSDKKVEVTLFGSDQH